MHLRRRELLQAAGAGLIGVSARFRLAAQTSTAAPPPITLDERRARIEHARELMRQNKLDAIYMESGTDLFYFTGVRWGQSERMFGAVIPARGDVAYICPKFEEGRAKELIKIGDDVRTWEEDQNPGDAIAAILKDRGIRGTVGIDEGVRFVFYDMIRKASPRVEFTSATPVTAGCRMIKSPAEIALLQHANDLTIAAYRIAFPKLKPGMSNREVSGAVSAAFRTAGAGGGEALVGLGAMSASPHGSILPQILKEGDIVLVDGGCSVDGYKSDITRTFVMGEPTKRQREIWDLEKRAQAAAFEAAKPGVTCESVDAAARKVIVDAGFGPDYKLPGLPHRTGHGIGLDGHEWTNLVRGNKTLIRPGMCFSDEPTVAIPGEFGIRLEDCMYITENGAKMFTGPSKSITDPVG